MGVSAAGKSTAGIALAELLGVPFVDGDALHSDENRAKMTAGIPLTDDDRWGWLDVVGARFGAAAESGLVLACSALKRSYRDRIRAGAPGVVFVHLHGERELLHKRVSDRKGHFMPAALLDSQLDTLEALAGDEPGFLVDVDQSPTEIVEEIADRLAAVHTRASTLS